MSIVQTVQVEHLALRLGGYPDYHAALSQLGSILSAYEDETDELSDNLFDWSDGVFSHFEENPGESVREIHAFAQMKLRELRHEILINDFNISNPDPRMRQTLDDPMIDRGWIWEKRVLDDYLRLSSLSPFDQQPIQARVHRFALAMIDWSEGLYTEPVGKDGVELGKQIVPMGLQAVPLFENGFVNQIKLRLYQEVAKNILAQMEMRKIRRQSRQELAALRHELHNLSKEEIRRVQQCAQEAIELIRNNIHELTRAHQQDVQALQEIQSLDRTRIKELETKKAAQERQLAVQQNLIEQLEHRLAHVEQVRGQQSQQLADAQKKSKKRNHGIYIRLW